MKIKKVYPGKNHDNILIMGTGPSVFYNMAKVKAFCEDTNPTIIGVNGALHGILSLRGETFQTTDPNGDDIFIDCSDIDSVIPHILFSFLLRRDKNTVDGIRILKDKDRATKKCDLFKNFILNHKKAIIDRDISLLCPDDRSFKIVKKRKAYGYKKYGQAKWSYSKSLEFAAFPSEYKGKKGTCRLGDIKGVKDLYDEEIKFKVGHGGEYLLAWAVGQQPKNIAIVGMCDFPNKVLDKLNRGWFWLDRVRDMPPKMSKSQSKIIEFIKSYYGTNFHDLNFSPV